MINGQVRRSQLVAPFGPGAMQVLADGTSIITAGLDYWFMPNPDRAGSSVMRDEFRIEEWRLERLLGVDALYMPPDYRWSGDFGPGRPNTHLTVPALRFPAWSFCPRCRALRSHPLHQDSRPRCEESRCAKTGTDGKAWSPFLSQVPFVAICEDGHVQDFPWVEWAHSSVQTDCRTPRLTLKSSGGGTLKSQRVSCSSCGRSRSLEGITAVQRIQGEHDSTVLTSSLDQGLEYSCRGAAPWLGLQTEGEPCGAPLRGSLRGASNVYYALVKSSIYVPESAAAGVEPTLLSVLQERSIEVARDIARELSEDERTVAAKQLRKAAKRSNNAWRLEDFTDEQIDEALSVLEGRRDGIEADSSDPTDQAPFRKEEYDLIRQTMDARELVVRDPAGAYRAPIASHFARVRLVEKLRETRVLWGFNRIYPTADTDVTRRGKLLRRFGGSGDESWLPAYAVLGEGIYLEIDHKRLAQWESRPDVAERVLPVLDRFHEVIERRRLDERDISPRLILLHTLGHLLINQLTYECGYSSASLRERLYASPGVDGMAGVLIYTAAGDSEGTLGGLVRMGVPGRLEGVLENALANARWCSSDPVCVESKGQGPDSCNLAACHSCALLPETSCEEFNHFLDRGLVTGTISNPALGFFSQ